MSGQDAYLRWDMMRLQQGNSRLYHRQVAALPMTIPTFFITSTPLVLNEARADQSYLSIRLVCPGGRHYCAQFPVVLSTSASYRTPFLVHFIIKDREFCVNVLNCT
jgi:hypothetical protein